MEATWSTSYHEVGAKRHRPQSMTRRWKERIFWRSRRSSRLLLMLSDNLVHKTNSQTYHLRIALCILYRRNEVYSGPFKQ